MQSTHMHTEPQAEVGQPVVTIRRSDSKTAVQAPAMQLRS